MKNDFTNIFFHLFTERNSKYVITGILIMCCSWCKILIATTKAREKKNTTQNTNFEEWLLQVKPFLRLLSRRFSKQVTQEDMPYPGCSALKKVKLYYFQLSTEFSASLFQNNWKLFMDGCAKDFTSCYPCSFYLFNKWAKKNSEKWKQKCTLINK